jgi:hypothetical protein
MNPKDPADQKKMSGVFCGHGIFCSQQCSEIYHEQQAGLDVTIGKTNAH